MKEEIKEEIKEVMDILECSEHQAVETILWDPDACGIAKTYEIPACLPIEEGWTTPSGTPFRGTEDLDYFYTSEESCLIGPSEGNPTRTLIEIDDICEIDEKKLREAFEERKNHSMRWAK